MPVSDTKKVATYINKAGKMAQRLRDELTELERIKQAMIDQSVSVVGTALDGNVSVLNTWLVNLRSEADSAVATALINNIVPTHGEDAI